MTEQIKKAALKEGTNVVTVVGTLVEKNLEEKSYTNSNGETVEQITGTISVRTGENEVHQVRLRSNKLTKAGNENGLFKGYMTIKNDFISVADCSNNPELVADEVSVNGKLTTNEYYGQDGQLKQFQQIEGKFVNRLRDTDNPTKRAEFEVDVFVSNARPEFVDEETTGRTTLETFIPSYSGVFPYVFKTVQEGEDFFQNELEKGQTVKVYGNLLNVKKEHKKMVEMGFGADKEEISYTYVSESLITNAKMPYEVESPLAFDGDAIKERLTKREVYLEQQKARQSGGNNQADTRPNAFGGAPSTPKKTDIPVDVSNLF